MTAIATVLAALGHTVSGSDSSRRRGARAAAGAGRRGPRRPRRRHVGDADAGRHLDRDPGRQPRGASPPRERGIAVLRRADLLPRWRRRRRSSRSPAPTARRRRRRCWPSCWSRPAWTPSSSSAASRDGDRRCRWRRRRRLVRGRGRRERRHASSSSAPTPLRRHQRRGRPPRLLRRLGPASSPAFDRFLAEPAARTSCAPTTRSRAALGRHGRRSVLRHRARRRLPDRRPELGARRQPRSGFVHHGAGPRRGRARRCPACTTAATPPPRPSPRPGSSACRSTPPPTALRRYAGVARRFEFRGEVAGVTFVDDYAHNSGRGAAGAGRRRAAAAGAGSSASSSRTATPAPQALCRDFGDAFDDADVVVVTDVYARRRGAPARASPASSSSTPCSTPPRARRALWLPRRDDVVRATCADELRPGDLCLTLGAGDVTVAARRGARRAWRPMRRRGLTALDAGARAALGERLPTRRAARAR